MNLTTILCKKLNEEKWHNLRAGVREKGEWDKGGGVSNTMTDIMMTNMIKTIRGSKDSKYFICHMSHYMTVKCCCDNMVMPT